jgi:phenylpropionate dioxygenase-like ring-hydroxylating dioxygenase large terminal subunit
MTVITPTIAPVVSRILGRVETELEEHRVPAEIWNNDAIFRAELDQVFGTCWVFVAHESEIPTAGDFVQRRIGLDPVIVTRDGTGGINVLSNYCRHRGTQVCQTDTGNSRFFKCPYHGWTYSNNGDLVGTPHMREAYGTRLDPKEWGLKRAPRVDVRSGFIFASLAHEGPSLDEYLGGGGWMLDILVNLAPGGVKVAGPPERYQVNADWKAGAENFSGDAYHADSLHWSNEEVQMIQGLGANAEMMHAYELGNGHATIGFPWPELVTIRKIGTPTVHLTCDFARPSMFGDLLTFNLNIDRVGGSSLHLEHVVSGANGMRWRARQILAATSLVDHHAIPWSDDIRVALMAHVGKGTEATPA